MAGGSIERLEEILGHYSVAVTERYAHLEAELVMAKDLGTIALDLSPGGAPVRLEDGQPLASAGDKRRSRTRNNKKKTGAAL